jgi:Rps23 Pro-64 3,4-dihydroxylase Tpa1-like proline 4-hydroxylase
MNLPWSEGVGKEYQMPEYSGSYGFSTELVRGRRNFSIQPTMGDLVIFNTRNFHEVKDSVGQRFSISSFFGLNKDEIIFWS